MRTTFRTVIFFVFFAFASLANAETLGLPLNAKILKTTGGQDSKHITIRLSKWLTKEQLDELSYRIVIKYNAPQRAMIEYYLPSQMVGANGWGPWASTEHTNGQEPKTKINFSSIEDVKTLKNFSAAKGWKEPSNKDPISEALGEGGPGRLTHGGKIVGEWIFDKRYTLIIKGSQYFINQIDPTGQQVTARVERSKSRNGYRYDKPSWPDEYFLVTSSKDLEIRNQQGVIVSLHPVH